MEDASTSRASDFSFESYNIKIEPDEDTNGTYVKEEWIDDVTLEGPKTDDVAEVVNGVLPFRIKVELDPAAPIQTGRRFRRGKMTFSATDDEKLIEFVKEHECLFNVASKNYRDSQMKLSLWRDIGMTLNKTGEECSKRWMYVRDYYVRRRGKPGTGSSGEMAKKRSDMLSFLDSIPSSKRGTLTNCEGPTVTPVDRTPLSASDHALPSNFDGLSEEGGSPSVVHMPRKRYSSLSDPGNQPFSSASDDLSSTEGVTVPTAPTPPPSKKKKTSLSEERLQILKQIAERNSTPIVRTENDLFFASMAQSVEQLPRLQQAKIRLEVANLISSAQIAHFRSESEQPT